MLINERDSRKRKAEHEGERVKEWIDNQPLQMEPFGWWKQANIAEAGV